MRQPLNLMGLLLGLAALLLCVSAPAYAQSVTSIGPVAHGETHDDMPCCPEVPTSINACALHCPLVVSPAFAFDHVPAENPVKFYIAPKRQWGLSYAPQAPPPR
jgi:hypothetical protein